MTYDKSHSSKANDAVLSEHESAEALAEDLIQNTPESEFDAKKILNQYPELNQHSIALDLAFEEYLQRVESGEDPDPVAFANRFPEYQQSLVRMLNVHRVLDASDELAPPKWPKSGDEFLTFDLHEELGRGAFSRVFLATEPDVGERPVVVKVCTHGSEEAHTLGQLQHPHIVPVFSVQHDPITNLTAICMPYKSRATLFDVVRHSFGESLMPARGRVLLKATELFNGNDERLAATGGTGSHVKFLEKCTFVESIVHLGVQLAEALDYTHEKGVYHCDIKPSNVLLDSDGQAMLFDFNLAFEEQVEHHAVGGTIAYMAPEQLRTVADPAGTNETIDARTDIFAFGVTMYQMLCGKLPFGDVPTEGSKRQIANELLARHAAGPAPVRKENARVDKPIARLIESCVAFEPASRPATSQLLSQQLRLYLTTQQRAKRWLTTRRGMLASAATVAAAATTVGVICWTVAGLGVEDTVAPSRTELPLTVVELEKLGWEAYDNGDYKTAEEYFTKLVDEDPSNPDWLFSRGRARMKAGKYEPAHRDFVATRKMVKTGPVFACVAYCSAQIAAQPMEFNAPISDFRESLRRGFSPAAVHNNMGFCYLNLWVNTGRPDNPQLKQANTHLQTAVSQNDLPEAIHNLAVADYYACLDDGDARLPNTTLIDEAIKLNSNNPMVYKDAVAVYAIRAKHVEDKAESDANLAEALEHCETAARMGVARGKLEFLGIPADTPGFQDILRKALGRLKDNKRLVDPLQGLGEPIPLTGRPTR